MERISGDISFLLEADKLKNVVRKTKNVSNDRFENDAEHSWHICLMAICLQKHANFKIDISRVLQMLVIHDLGEVYSGDVIVYEKTAEHQKSELESAEKLFSILDESQREYFMGLLREFESRETNEAIYANAIDRMEPILQNINNNGETWKANGIEFSRILEVNRQKVREGSVRLWNFLLSKLEQLKSKGII